MVYRSKYFIDENYDIYNGVAHSYNCHNFIKIENQVCWSTSERTDIVCSCYYKNWQTKNTNSNNKAKELGTIIHDIQTSYEQIKLDTILKSKTEEPITKNSTKSSTSVSPMEYIEWPSWPKGSV